MQRHLYSISFVIISMNIKKYTFPDNATELSHLYAYFQGSFKITDFGWLQSLFREKFQDKISEIRFNIRAKDKI